MKLSFSLSSSSSSSSSSKPKPKPKPSPSSRPLDDDPPTSSSSLPQYVTVFDPSQTLTPSSLTSTPLIPPLPNTNQWRAPKRMKNLVPPPNSSDDPDPSSRFVVAPSDDPHAPARSYGLTLRSSTTNDTHNDDDEKHKEKEKVKEKEKQDKTPPPRARPEAADELRRFRMEIESLPEDRGIEEFQEIAVEDFSRAVLAGYGWKEGRGIGRNSKEDVKVVEQRRWAGTAGLGFDPDAPTKDPGADDGGKPPRKPDGSRKNYGRGSGDEKKSARADRDGGERRKADNAPVHWLRSQIKVRVISKDYKRGRLYLKKGVVTDVVDPVTCDLAMDETRELVQGVDQEMLETALPHRGGPVIVLYGRHKGVYGKLVEKDRENEVAVVRDADSHEMFKVRMEQIAEYVGDPGDIGY